MASNFNKAERYIKQDGEYKLLSYATSSESVEMTGGTDLQTKVNEMDTNISNKIDKTTVAKFTELGLIKSGEDIIVNPSGTVRVKDNSHNHTVSNISDLTATASELNILDGITATTAELNYTDGVTSNIQTQLNGKSPTSHASTASTYGLGTTENYGHVKTVNNLTTSAHADGLALSAYQGKLLNDEINSLKETLLSHIGMIIHSTTLDTMEKVIAIYGGTTWVKIEGKFLLGTSDSHAINSTGGEETHTLTVNEIPSHNHTGPRHSHGLNGHTHRIPALKGTAISDGSHTHTSYKYSTAISVQGGGSDYNYNALVTGNQNLGNAYNNTGSAGAHTHSVTTNASYTEGNSDNTAAAGTGNTGDTGEGIAHNNMPPYKTVYIWERTA